MTPQAGNTYVWKKYANIIPGAVGNSYTAKNTGIYKAIVTSPNACTRTTNPRTVSAVCPVVAVKNTSSVSDESFIVAPNPATDATTLTFKQNNPGVVTILISDVTGRIVTVMDSQRMDEDIHQIEMNTSAFDAGIYEIILISEDRKMTSKLVITSNHH